MEDFNNLMAEVIAANQKTKAVLIRMLRQRNDIKITGGKATPAQPRSRNVELEKMTEQVADSNARLKRIEERRGLQ
jgi:hypothetical protein